MKTIFLIIISTFVLNAQSDLLLLMNSDVSFIDPIVYDSANTLALYDGDLELSTTAWNNQMSASFDMTLTGSPSITTSTVNGHKVVTLNGSSQYGAVSIPTLDRPVTYYLVYREISYTAGDYVFDGYGSNSSFAFRQSNVSPNHSLTCAGNEHYVNPSIGMGTWYIMTAKLQSDSAFYWLNGVSKDKWAPASTIDPNGFTLGSRAAALAYGHIEVAWIALRKGKDSDAVSILWEAYLANRFGITLP